MKSKIPWRFLKLWRVSVRRRPTPCPTAPHGPVEGAIHAAEPVVDLPDPVQADPDVGEAGVLDLARRLVGDQRAVRGKRRPDPEGPGVRNQVEEVGPRQRLRPREPQGPG